jgi:hypothetical protein
MITFNFLREIRDDMETWIYRKDLNRFYICIVETYLLILAMIIDIICLPLELLGLLTFGILYLLNKRRKNR